MSPKNRTRLIATIGLALNTLGAVLLIFHPVGKLWMTAGGFGTLYAFNDNVGAYLALVILAAGFPFQIWALWRQ